MKVFIVLLLMVGLGYGISRANSPSADDSKLNTFVINTGVNEAGDAAMKISFTIDLDQQPIFSKQHHVNMQWNTGWKLESYFIKENGKNVGSDVTVSPFNYSGHMNLPINTQKHIDENGVIEGYVVLTSENEKMIKKQLMSSITVDFYYQSLVKDFKLNDSIGWSNAESLNRN